MCLWLNVRVSVYVCCVCDRGCAWVCLCMRACAFANKGWRVEVLLQFSGARDIFLDNTTNQFQNLTPRSARCSSDSNQYGIDN